MVMATESDERPGPVERLANWNDIISRQSDEPLEYSRRVDTSTLLETRIYDDD